jgi:hypothetical protein
MKKTILAICLLLFTQTALFAQTEKWKEMENFHEVMSATFHPAEENNFAPLKKHAAELLDRAKKWKASTAPAGYNAKTVAPILEKLVLATDEVNKAVKAKKSDVDLKKLITKAHHVFHEIAEKCRD